MIIRSDGNFETNSLFPDSDWYNEGNEVIDETTEEGRALAEKVIELYPAYTLVRDSEGKVIDVIDDPVKRAEIEQQQQEAELQSPPSLEERIQALEQLELMRLFNGGDKE